MFVLCLKYLTKLSSVMRENRHLRRVGGSHFGNDLRGVSVLRAAKLGVPLGVFLLIIVTGLTADAYGQGASSFFESPWRGYDTGTFATGYDPGGFGPGSIASGDIDGDGDSDVLVGNYYAGRPGLSVLMNAGDGTYSWPTFYTLTDNKSVRDVALSDLDRDGDLDALATIPDLNGLSKVLALWRNNGNGTFAPPVEFATGQGPAGMVVADFNGDGFSDVATANYGYISGQNSTISILQHNGLTGAAAGFLAPIEFTANGIHTEGIATADLNGDGRMDLVVGGKDLIVEPGKLAPTGSRLGVLLNNGAGGFTLSATYESVPGSRLSTGAVALADLDNDGDADLIGGGLIPNGSSDNGAVSVRRNSGNGTFGSPEIYFFENSVDRPQSFTIGDLNRDGFTDIVACVPTGRTTDGWVALLNNRSGGFLPAVRYEASQQTVDAALTDADADGDLDVVTVAKSSAAITVHRNPGNGLFTVPHRILVGQSSQSLFGNYTHAVEAGDLDRDGDLDIVTNDEKAYILKNNGDGSFANSVSYAPPMNFGEVKLRDLNGDGHLDLLFGPDRNVTPYHFGSALNNGNGTFAPGTITHVNACAAGSVDAFDLDGDRDLDVVLTEEGSCMGGPGNRIFIARNDGSAKFTLVSPLIPGCGPWGIDGADLNGDGRTDLATGDCGGVGVFLGNGNLTFKPKLVSSANPFRFRLADMNHDGKIDVAMIVSLPPWGTAIIGTGLGNGDGTFAPARTRSGSSVLENLTISNDIDLADADADGDLDVLVSNNASNDLSLLLNNGDGSLRAHERYGVGNSPTFSAFADFTGDGAPDVASAIAMPPAGLNSAVVIMRNLGLNNLIGEPLVTVTSPANGATYAAPATIHVTADVKPVANRSITKVEFYLGDGSGSNQKLVHTDTTAPYGFDLTNQVEGKYSLYAFAYDSEGVGISNGVRYEVTPPGPAPKITPTITWNSPADIIYGTALSTTQLNATSNVSGTLTYSPAAGALLNAGVGQTLTVNFVPTDTNTYTNATKSVVINVNRAATTLALTSSANPSIEGQSVTFTAIVTSAAGTPGGTVQFKDNGNNLGAPVLLSAGGVATLSIADLSVATHVITADYSGNTNFSASTSTLANGQVVNNLPKLIQLGSATYAIREDAANTAQGFSSISVDVKRTGDISAAATVQYLTSDQSGSNECDRVTGQASQRCDYLLVAGTLRFDAGEATKTISIPVINDGYQEGTEFFYIQLRNPSGGDLGTTTQATITIDDDSADVATGTGANNPYLSNSFFVRMNYLDFLGRDPDTKGFNDWTTALNTCGPEKGFLGAPQQCDRAHVSHGFFGSEEFTNTGFLIYRMYEVGMNRLPRYSEFTPDMASLSGFGLSEDVKQKNQADYLQQFTARQEFQTRFQGALEQGQASELIRRLEQTAGVGLPDTVITQPGQPTQYGRQQLIDLRASGTFTVGQTLKAFAEQQPVYDIYFSRGEVTMLYFAYLKRDPDLNDPNLSGWSGWVKVFSNGGIRDDGVVIGPRDIHHLIFGFIYSEEYRKRFGQP